MSDNKAETAAAVLFHIYSAIGMLVGTACLIRDTMNAYYSGGPAAGAFWFFTVGPIISFFEGMLWPISICVGCAGLL